MSNDFLNLEQEFISNEAPEILVDDLKASIEKLNDLIEKNRFSVIRAQNSGIEFHFNQAIRMLKLARENLDKGFLHVCNAFLQLGTDHLKKCGILL